MHVWYALQAVEVD